MFKEKRFKISIQALIYLTIGTLLFDFGIFLPLFIENINVILYILLLSTGLILFIIGLLLILLIKNEYHVIKLKKLNNFPLKLDHLIMFCCYLSIGISVSISLTLASFKYSFIELGTSFNSLFLLITTIIITLPLFIIYYRKKSN